MGEVPTPSAFYTGLVAELYGALRSSETDPEPYARFVTRGDGPALELGCGDGEPLLDLRARGLDVEGLDSSPDMLARCREAAAARGLDVVLHEASMEAMALGRTYRSIYLAGPTFNLLPDDDAAGRALARIAAHLDPGGVALVPLFVPTPDAVGAVGRPREHVDADGRLLRVTAVSVARDDGARTQTTLLRYELVDAERAEVLERPWLLHWFSPAGFAELVAAAGLTVVAARGPTGAPVTPDDASCSFLLRR